MALHWRIWCHWWFRKQMVSSVTVYKIKRNTSNIFVWMFDIALPLSLCRGLSTAKISSKKNDGSNIVELGIEIQVIFSRDINHGFKLHSKAKSIICNLSLLGLNSSGFLSSVQVTAATDSWWNSHPWINQCSCTARTRFKQVPILLKFQVNDYDSMLGCVAWWKMEL